MEGGNYIKFLGTAGARFAVARQARSSAGVFLHLCGKHIILDPGPGTLVQLAAAKPRIEVTELDAIILSHAHIDHSNDVNILIDGMRTAAGSNKKGFLFAPKGCIYGDDAILFNYLRDSLAEIVFLQENKEYHLGDLSFISSIRHNHSVETYGIKFKVQNYKVSFIVDTKFFPQLIESYRDTDLLILNVVLKEMLRDSIQHLNLDDAARLIRELRPSKAVLTHFGMTMLRANPNLLAQQLTTQTGVPVIAAFDGMTIDLK